MNFKAAVEATPNLRGKWKAGLGALRGQDKLRIKPEDSSKTSLRGSVDIDKALLKEQPRANRWDFAIGCKHANRSEEFVCWVETHTGSDGEIKVMLRKLEWLKTWLKEPKNALAKFDKEFIWAPSGPTSFTAGSTQVKKLAEQGLRYSGSTLRIPLKHKTDKH